MIVLWNFGLVAEYFDVPPVFICVMSGVHLVAVLIAPLVILKSLLSFLDGSLECSIDQLSDSALFCLSKFEGVSGQSLLVEGSFRDVSDFDCRIVCIDLRPDVPFLHQLLDRLMDLFILS